ncbi:MAG: cupin domain-containing protein [Armatimonadota bacterium]|nr:cupin domain-containing protein [Armatimonadota bacterium]
MPQASRATAFQVEVAEGFEGRYQEVGSYTIGFETYTAHADLTPLFKGLPDDRCQCPHWGIVLQGKLVYHYADGDDVSTAGEAYYAAPGHTPEIFPDTEVVESSPTVELRKTMDVVMKNVAAMGG